MTENDEPTRREGEPPWVHVDPQGHPRTTNLIELVAPAMLAMPEPMRLRWVAALNSNQFDIRLMQPDPDLDPEDPRDAERRLRLAIEEIPSPDRERLLQILTSADAIRAEAIGSLHATGLTPSTVELLIDTEEEPALRALLVGLLREHQHSD